ncbi:type II secretion system F family protein [Frigidibacter sp. MR17.24]|uniref:type II secretion system F family protein n=1 Tax=Frigidibacter sp. MR17.24 TaxID=3127345 RepID=UPI003012A00E
MLTQLNDAIVARLGPLGPLYVVAGLGLLLILCTLPIFLGQKADPLKKLKDEGSAAPGRGAKDDPRRALRTGKTDKLQKFATFLEPKSEEEMGTARLKMMRAGYRGKTAVRTFHAIQFAIAIFALVMGTAYALIESSKGAVTPAQMTMYTLLPAALGYYLPRYWLNRRITERQKQMQNGFPDALDMLLVCVEAGQSLDQSIIRVAKELQTGYPALAEEFEMVSYEVKAGKDKTAVLKAFAERSGLSDIASFVTVMIQSAQFGTSIAEALRVYAADMRDKRVMRAEELANKLPTKITLGTMLFTVPPLLVILVGPSILSIIEMFATLQ